MKTFLEKVKYEISRAAECLESKVSKNADVFRVQIESLQDSVSLFHIAAASKKSSSHDFSKVLADAQSTLRNLISRLDRAENEEKSATRTSLPNSSGVKSTAQRNLVEIPKFRGDDPLKFHSFMALFMDRFHSNSSLTNIEKFILLMNHLEGEAYDVVNEIPITEESFSICLNVLEEMYGDEDYIDALFDRVVRLPAVSTGEIAEIRKTYWKLEAILRSLDQLGEPINEIGFLRSLYAEKFANVSDLQIEKFSAVQLAKLRRQVRHFILTKEQSSISAFASFKNSSWNDPEESKTETAVPSNEIVECIFCSEGHYSEDCTVYPSAFQRKKQLQHLCYKCLEAKHVGKPCVTFEKCVYCNEDSHNRVFCPQKCRNVGLGGASEKLSDEFLASSSQDPKPTSSEPLTNDDFFHPTTPLTTCTVVELASNRKKTSLRLVIASGSKSKISESAVCRLGITSSQINEVLARSNATGYATKVLNINVLVHVLNGAPVPLQLRIVKEICDKTVITPTVAEFQKEHPHLAGMHFPDTGSGLPIEMVIGGDTELASVAFNGGLDEECPRVKRGWSLVSTRFGWIILGKDKSNEPFSFSMAMDSS